MLCSFGLNMKYNVCNKTEHCVTFDMNPSSDILYCVIFFINQSERNKFFFAKHITHQIELILEKISVCILGKIHKLF